MVFLSAWLAQLIGLEAILGAFFAGLVLNRYIPAASPLMGSIEFVGNALFIPYFLISVGMMINLNVVFEQNTLIIASLWCPNGFRHTCAKSSRALISIASASYTASHRRTPLWHWPWLHWATPWGCWTNAYSTARYLSSSSPAPWRP